MFGADTGAGPRGVRVDVPPRQGRTLQRKGQPEQRPRAEGQTAQAGATTAIKTAKGERMAGPVWGQGEGARRSEGDLERNKREQGSSDSAW